MLDFAPGNTSLINWLAATGTRADLLEDSLKYDNQKTDRLELLNKLIGLPINVTDYVNGEDFDLSSPTMQALIERRGGGEQLLAFRVSPKEEYVGSFDILKKYGVTFEQFNQFFTECGIEPKKASIRITDYRGELAYSAIIVVSEEGIIGEFVAGDLYKLTYADALEDQQELVSFYWEPAGVLSVNSTNPDYIRKIEEILQQLRVENQTISQLSEQGFTVAHNFICGYYEYIEGSNGGGAFTDANNKKIATNIKVSSTIDFLRRHQEQPEQLSGFIAHAPRPSISGVVHIIGDDTISDFSPGCILVCKRTHVGYLQAMKQALAIITEQGGIMSHPAIIARELGVPCVVGCARATQVLQDGDMVEINATTGLVRKL